MARVSPSNWRTPSLKAVAEEIDTLYTDEIRRNLLDMLRFRSEEKRRRIEYEILITASNLDIELRVRDATNFARVLTSLRSLEAPLTRLSEQLNDLDSETKSVIQDQAGKDKTAEFHDDYITEKFGPYAEAIRGGQRLVSVVDQLAAFRRWIASSVDALDGEHRGRPAFNAEREAISALWNLWNEPNAKPFEATEADFHAFVHAALDPVFEVHGSTPDLGSTIRYVQEHPDVGR